MAAIGAWYVEEADEFDVVLGAKVNCFDGHVTFVAIHEQQALLTINLDAMITKMFQVIEKDFMISVT